MDCLAFVALSLPPLWANVLFGLILISGFFAVFWLDTKQQAE
jgi:hypothetical protein